MANLNPIFVSSALLLIVAVTFVSSEISSEASLVRSPRSIGNVIRRWFTGRRKQTGFQGTAQANQPYSFGSYGQASASYPSYALPVYPGLPYSPNYFQNGYQGYSGYPVASASNQYQTYAPSASYSPSAYSSSASYSPSASSYSPSASYSPSSSYSSSSSYTPPATFTPQSYGQSPGTMDFNQVLDQFVRSAGLSPQGDHEAPSLQSKGDSFAKSGTTPVFTFKKLYSFPFFMSTDQNSGDAYNYQTPFLKRHTRRMSPEAQLIEQSLLQQSLGKQFFVPPVIKPGQTNPRSDPQNIQPEKQLSQSQDYLQAEDIEQQL